LNTDSTPKSFIKNPDLLKESSEVDDLLDFSETVNAMRAKIDSVKSGSIIGLVGRFGSGKSTMLYQLQKQDSDRIWFVFDAWKYPNREHLWEGFILDFAESVGVLKKVKDKISGDDLKSKGLAASAGILSFFSGLPFLDRLAEYFKTAPATRVSEMQRVLLELINKQEHEIYFVIEDIDRSGDAGIYFLETVRQFLWAPDIIKRVVAVVPIGNKKFQERQDSYLKCLDYVEFFQPKRPNLERFLRELIDSEMLNAQFEHNHHVYDPGLFRKSQVQTFLEQLFMSYPEMSPRLLKLIFRAADLSYRRMVSDGLTPDWSIVLCFAASKYLRVEHGSDLDAFDIFKSNRTVPRKSAFAGYLASIPLGHPSIYGPNDPIGTELTPFYPESDVELVESSGTFAGSRPFPWYVKDRPLNKASFYCSDVYLNY
jgi:hypothetical protein